MIFRAFRFVVALAGVGLGIATPAAAEAAPAADTVIRNGTVLTMNKKQPQTQAVALSDGRIVFVGSNRAAKRWVGRRTKVINLKGKTAMPGLIDGHSHPRGGGDLLNNCDLGNIEATVAEMVDIMLSCDQLDPPSDDSDWLEVSNWSPVGMLPEGTVVSKADLDAAFPDRPVYVQGSDFHNSWVNSRALELAGVDKNTPEPTDGTIVRDDQGNPTGLLVDGAQALVSSAIPPKHFEEEIADGLRGVKAMNAVGITSAADAAAEETSLKVWKALAKRGKMTLRMNSFPVVGNSQPVNGAVSYYKSLARRYATERLRIPGVKMFMDGVIEYPAQTAALIDPYLRKQGNDWVPGDNRGDYYFTQAHANQMVTRFDKLNKLVHMHAIGDGAVREGLNAVAAARKANKSYDRDNVSIAHLQLVDPADYGRFTKLGVFATMQLQWAISNFWTEQALHPFIGDERYGRMYPARSLVKAGAPFSMGSDWPVDPLNPWREIMTAQTRSSDYGGVLLPNQSIPIARALRAHTLGSAQQLRIANRVGSLKKGMDADIIILDRNPLKVKPSQVLGTEVLRTIVRGKTVYQPSRASASLIARANSRSGGEVAHDQGH